jgi:hypothetical protein
LNVIRQTLLLAKKRQGVRKKEEKDTWGGSGVVL